MKRAGGLAAILLVCAFSPLWGEQMPVPSPKSQLPEKPSKEESPWPTGTMLDFMIHPLKHGMALFLPSIATDPNSGVTYGVMPIWVLQSPETQQIQYINAPSVTYNQYFGWSPTYRLYYYPNPDSNLVLRAAWDRYEHEAFASYDDQKFLHKNIALDLLFQDNVDASRRFFGIGPGTPLSAQTNYTEDYLRTQASLGIPLGSDSFWKIYATNHFVAERTVDGPIAGLPSFQATYPGQFSSSRQNVDEWRLALAYDSRDGTITPTHGALLKLYAGYSAESMGSQYDYDRYGVDARYLHGWSNPDAGTTAVQFQCTQLLGKGVPFWALSSLGGKYSLRAYGDGRFIDNGMAALNAEERFTVYQKKMAGVQIEAQVAPFAGVGTVFDSPENSQSKYLHPVIGTAFRAIAPPQVVGSIDLGFGQEGAAIFMDVNYSF
ncbi:MAG TPA: BamA/TamA family outer membrane protein [Elusimicrobiota bacterium]|nr:BamA/TamA family outer membrane protein [Elusimicrobiota bacterium]